MRPVLTALICPDPYSSKFIEKFGMRVFRAQYLPLYKSEGKKHLPGMRFMFDSDGDEKAWQKDEKERKKADKKGASIQKSQ